MPCHVHSMCAVVNNESFSLWPRIARVLLYPSGVSFSRRTFESLSFVWSFSLQVSTGTALCRVTLTSLAFFLYHLRWLFLLHIVKSLSVLFVSFAAANTGGAPSSPPRKLFRLKGPSVLAISRGEHVVAPAVFFLCFCFLKGANKTEQRQKPARPRQVTPWRQPSKWRKDVLDRGYLVD